jgi:DUF4097 and DUF4098 domain-containing protein YvlB
LRGDVLIEQGVGRFTLQTGSGDVKVKKLAGDLKIQGESGRVSIEEVTGVVDLSWLTGDVHLKGVLGGGRIDVNESRLSLGGCRGEWIVSVARGKAEISQCAGNLTANGQSTAWNLRSAERLEAEIKSATGPVTVEWKSGAKVFLTSNSGPISGPRFRSKLDSEGRRIAEFTVGQKPFSAVFVKTESGPIMFK